MLATGSRFDTETQPLKDRAEFSVVPAFAGIGPYDQNARRSQEMHEPIQRGFEGLDRLQLPVNESYIKPTVRKAAGRRCRDAIVSTAMQLENVMGASRTGKDDSMKLGTPGQLDHRLDDFLA
jgi:hypothetical protein